MLHDFVSLAPATGVMQNAGNSGVGQAVIQFSKRLGWKTVSVVRRDEQVAPLKALGADAVVVDGPTSRRGVAAATAARSRGSASTRSPAMRPAGMANALADGGTVVNYGLLSGRPCEMDASDTVFPRT